MTEIYLEIREAGGDLFHKKGQYLREALDTTLDQEDTSEERTRKIAELGKIANNTGEHSMFLDYLLAKVVNRKEE